jgi:hypothetical protein
LSEPTIAQRFVQAFGGGDQRLETPDPNPEIIAVEAPPE